MKRIIASILMSFTLLGILAGCGVNQNTYNTVLQERDSLQEQVSQLEKQLSEKEELLQRSETEQTTFTEEKQALLDELTTIKKQNEDLQGTLATLQTQVENLTVENKQLKSSKQSTTATTAQNSQAAQTPAKPAQTPVEETPQATYVWIPKTGSKYHSNSSCSNMKNPSQVTREQAINMGFSACKKCW